jgi:hypothetical protein
VTPAYIEILLFALSVSFSGCLVFAYMLGLTIGLTRESRRRNDRAKAEEKGAALLRSWLSPQQAEMWDSHGLFYVFGSDTGRCYRIKYGRAMNIDELDSRGNAVAKWCFHPTGNLAVGDVLLAQKIALETMELETLAKANRNWMSVPAC